MTWYISGIRKMRSGKRKVAYKKIINRTNKREHLFKVKCVCIYIYIYILYESIIDVIMNLYQASKPKQPYVKRGTDLCILLSNT
jgi:hypothetical protein